MIMVISVIFYITVVTLHTFYTPKRSSCGKFISGFIIYLGKEFWKLGQTAKISVIKDESTSTCSWRQTTKSPQGEFLSYRGKIRSQKIRFPLLNCRQVEFTEVKGL